MWAGYKWEKKGENAQTAKNTLTAVEPVPWVSSDAADKVHVIGKQTHNNVYWYWLCNFLLKVNTSVCKYFCSFFSITETNKSPADKQQKGTSASSVCVFSSLSQL